MEDLEHKLYSLQDADALSHARCPFLSSLSPSGKPSPAPQNAVRLDVPSLSTADGGRARVRYTEREREREQYEIRWKWNRRGARRLPHGREEEREGRAARGVPRRTRSVCVAGWLWGRERADRQSGRRASRVGMGTVSLSRFQMQMWRGREREGGRAFGRQGRRSGNGVERRERRFAFLLRRWRKGDKTATRVGFKCD